MAASNPIPQASHAHRGMSLISMVMALLVIMVLFMMFMNYGRIFRAVPTPDNPEGKSMPAVALDRARGVSCMNNIRQIQQAIFLYKNENESLPGSISELTSYGITPDLAVCPSTKQPYEYDPSTGTVRCPYHSSPGGAAGAAPGRIPGRMPNEFPQDLPGE